MKKLILLSIVAVVSIAQADYLISTASYWGNTVGGAGITANIGDQAAVQLIYAGANGVADDTGTIDIGTANGDLLYGDDVLIGTFIFENTGALYEDVAAFAGIEVTGAYLGAPIYGRIFSSAAPGVGDNYYIGGIVQTQDKDLGASPPPTPNAYNLVPAGLGGSQEATGVVIPEPATIGLMGIAGLGMFLARRKSQR